MTTQAPHTPEVIEKIARAFIAELTSWVKNDNRSHMKKQKIDREFVENANDFYDANMAMDAAFKKCGFDTFASGKMTSQSMDVFNDAWEKAITIVSEVKQ